MGGCRDVGDLGIGLRPAGQISIRVAFNFSVKPKLDVAPFDWKEIGQR